MSKPSQAKASRQRQRRKRKQERAKRREERRASYTGPVWAYWETAPDGRGFVTYVGGEEPVSMRRDHKQGAQCLVDEQFHETQVCRSCGTPWAEAVEHGWAGDFRYWLCACGGRADAIGCSDDFHDREATLEPADGRPVGGDLLWKTSEARR